MPSPIKPWRSYLLNSHGANRVRPYPVRLDPRTLSQSLVRVPLIPYKGALDSEDFAEAVSRAMGERKFFVTEDRLYGIGPQSV
jgi:hypothetical protein